jgi:hypothetical protein
MAKQIIASRCPIRQVEDRSDKYTISGDVAAIYALEAVPKGGKTFLLEVGDAFQSENVVGTYNNGVWNRRKITVTAEEIANCLVRTWAENSPLINPQQGPAIWLYNPETAAADEAFQEERQKRYALAVVQHARALHKDGKKTQITDQMRFWGQFLGLKEDWQTDEIGGFKNCVFCTKRIPVEAIKCPECMEIVDRERYMELAGTPVAAAAQGEKKAGNGRHVYG